MSRICFQVLCDEIEEIIGIDEFKSETHLNRWVEKHHNHPRSEYGGDDFWGGEISSYSPVDGGGASFLSMALLFGARW